MRRNVAVAIDQTIKYYPAEVGDRMANVYDIADAAIAECFVESRLMDFIMDVTLGYSPDMVRGRLEAAVKKHFIAK